MMPHTQAGGPSIYYETHGDAAGAPLVLIEGMGAQLIGWRDGFVDRLVNNGMRVIRLDNRDVGFSEKLGAPGEHGAKYAVSDMADDVCRVLDSLSFRSAHIVGQSLGGAVAQTLAVEHADRVRSLVLFYTAPAFQPQFLTSELIERLGVAQAAPLAPPSRDEAIELFVQSERYAASTGFAFDEVWMRELGARSYDRGYRPDGALRQSAAALSFGGGDWPTRLSEIACPTSIIHGRADRLVKYEAGIELARLIAHADLHLYAGMGHQIVPALWDDFVSIIARTTAKRS